jgi:hypothetical protein
MSGMGGASSPFGSPTGGNSDHQVEMEWVRRKRYQPLDPKNHTLMEVKTNMCRVLLTVSDLRLDFRVTKLVNLFKLSLRDMGRAKKAGAASGGYYVLPQTQEKMAKALLVEEKPSASMEDEDHSDGHLFKLKKKTRKAIADLFTNEVRCSALHCGYSR